MKFHRRCRRRVRKSSRWLQFLFNWCGLELHSFSIAFVSIKKRRNVIFWPLFVLKNSPETETVARNAHKNKSTKRVISVKIGSSSLNFTPLSSCDVYRRKVMLIWAWIYGWFKTFFSMQSHTFVYFSSNNKNYQHRTRNYYFHSTEKNPCKLFFSYFLHFYVLLAIDWTCVQIVYKVSLSIWKNSN